MLPSSPGPPLRGRRHGLTVAVLAPDGAGKSTLVTALAPSLPWPTATGYLGLEGGRFARRRRRVPGLGLAARLSYAWVTHGRTRRLRRGGGVVLYDRHPCEFLTAPEPSSAMGRTRRTVLAHSLPRPDLVLVLDTEPEVLFARKPEHPLPHVVAARERYLALARSLPGAVVIDAGRRPEDVVATARAAITQAYALAEESR